MPFSAIGIAWFVTAAGGLALLIRKVLPRNRDVPLERPVKFREM